MAPSAFAYFPLTFALPESGAKLLKNTEENIQKLKESGNLPPGLAEQYELQLAALRNPAVPDCQLISGRGLTIDDHRAFSFKSPIFSRA